MTFGISSQGRGVVKYAEEGSQAKTCDLTGGHMLHWNFCTWPVKKASIWHASWAGHGEAKVEEQEHEEGGRG